MVDAVGFAVGMAVATFFSPCAYPLLPGYVGFYASQAEEGVSLGGALARGVVAAGGVVVTFGLLVGGAFWIGQDRLEGVTIFEPIVGLVLVLFGALVVLGRAPSLRVSLPARRSSVPGFGVFGAGYALAAAGCAAPFFIGVVARALSVPATEGTVLLSTYVGLLALLMLSVTVATGMGLLAGSNAFARYAGEIERAAGGLMILAGVGQLYVAEFVTYSA